MSSSAIGLMGKRVHRMTTERGSVERIGLMMKVSWALLVDECRGGNPFVANVFDRFGRLV